MRVLIKDWHALGDACENMIACWHLTQSVKDIAINFEGFAVELFDNVPWLDRSINAGNADKIVSISMDEIHRSSQNSLHVVRCIENDLERALSDEKNGIHIRIKSGDMRLPIVFSEYEQKTCDAFLQGLGLPLAGYWIIDAGYKVDYPVKHWGFDNYQKLVDLTKDRIVWAQIGTSDNVHRPLQGAVNLIDRTRNLRDLCRLFWRSAGVVTPISSPCHLATMPMYQQGERFRPCVILHGGRESVSFTQYPNQHHLHALGMLDCCRMPCWKSSMATCAHPCRCGGEVIGKCHTLITPERVAETVLNLV